MDALEQRKGELFEKIKKAVSHDSGWLYWLGLIPVLILSWYIRTRNLPWLAGKYLIELDSYFFFRYAKMIYETGVLPAIDFMRYSPLGYPTAPFEFFPKTLAYMYKFIHVFNPSLPQIQWHIFYPPVITIISFVFFFLLVKELFNYKTALISTAFLAVIPAYIQRTSAGFADHEAMAMLWMFISLWLFVLSWKSEKFKYSLPLTILSGLFAMMMIGTWGGYRYLTLSVGLFAVLASLGGLLNKHKLINITAWFLLAAIGTSLQFSGKLFAIRTLFNLDLVPFLFAILCYFIQIGLPKIKAFEPIVKKMGLRASTALFTVLVAILALIGTGQARAYVDEFLAQIFKIEVRAGVSKFWMTVSESQRPDFFGGSGLWANFGWFIPLSVMGAGLIVFLILKYADNLKDGKFALAGSASFLAFVIIFTSVSFPSGNPIAQFLAKTVLLWFVLLFSVTLFCIYKILKIKNDFLNGKAILLLVIALYVIAFFVSHNQIRMLFAFAPMAAIISAATLTRLADYAGRKNSKLVTVALVIIVLLLLWQAIPSAIAQNKGAGSMIPGQWDNAMTFLREQTPKDSVVAHWWDYGHMTVAIGERTAVTDGGNVRSWNHDSGRYFLTGKDRESTLSYLKTHKVTHILISDQEIPKYHAFSLIGSETNMDRYSTIGTFALQDVREARDGTNYLYGGGWTFDQNIVIGNLVLSAGQAQIVGFSTLASNNSISQPKAYVQYQGKQMAFDITCTYKNGARMAFPETSTSLKGCLVLVPFFQDQTNWHEDGGAFWASEKAWDTNFARLYLYGENDPNFKQVYSDSLPLALYQGRSIGPIKIWEVQYPEGVQENPLFLEGSAYG